MRHHQEISSDQFLSESQTRALALKSKRRKMTSCAARRLDSLVTKFGPASLSVEEAIDDRRQVVYEIGVGLKPPRGWPWIWPC